jgi:hypothetical protein
MKFHNLYITTNTFETYQKVTSLLNITPVKETSDFSLWTYQAVENEEDDGYFDFVNKFLDILEPNFERLKVLGIEKNDILIWQFYEYDKQCSMSFNPQELKRFGESGISFNIDCIQKNS